MWHNEMHGALREKSCYINVYLCILDIDFLDMFEYDKLWCTLKENWIVLKFSVNLKLMS